MAPCLLALCTAQGLLNTPALKGWNSPALVLTLTISRLKLPNRFSWGSLREQLKQSGLRFTAHMVLALLLHYLRPLAHPGARLAYRVTIALSALERTRDLPVWVLREIPKLDRELRELAKHYPELSYVRAALRKLRQLLKETP